MDETTFAPTISDRGFLCTHYHTTEFILIIFSLQVQDHIQGRII